MQRASTLYQTISTQQSREQDRKTRVFCKRVLKTKNCYNPISGPNITQLHSITEDWRIQHSWYSNWGCFTSFFSLFCSWQNSSAAFFHAACWLCDSSSACCIAWHRSHERNQCLLRSIHHAPLPPISPTEYFTLRQFGMGLWGGRTGAYIPEIALHFLGAQLIASFLEVIHKTVLTAITHYHALYTSDLH